MADRRVVPDPPIDLPDAANRHFPVHVEVVRPTPVPDICQDSFTSGQSIGDSIDAGCGMKPESAETKFTRLYEAHYDEVLAYYTRRIGRTDGDEAAADVFAVAWRRLDEIDWETVRPFLFGIARSVLANRWRSTRRHRRLLNRMSGLAPVPRELPEDQVVRRAEDEEVLESLRRMKASDREVLMLNSWEELTAPEIAHALGISVSATEQRLHRAKKRLAKILAPTVAHPKVSPRAAEERGGER